jgi:hypothetical protein
MSVAKKIYPFKDITKPEEAKKSSSGHISQDVDLLNSEDKRQIEVLKKIIGEKMKDPALSKKAAMIIAEMLNKK